MDRFQPSTDNPITPNPEGDAGEHAGNRADDDREPYVGNDIMSSTQEGTEKAQVSLDPDKVADAERKGLGFGHPDARGTQS